MIILHFEMTVMITFDHVINHNQLLITITPCLLSTVSVFGKMADNIFVLTLSKCLLSIVIISLGRQTFSIFQFTILNLIWTWFASFQSGPFVKLQMGQETSYYVDNEMPTHCFCPCGHMASQRTVRLVIWSYWQNIVKTDILWLGDRYVVNKNSGVYFTDIKVVLNNRK